jgi:PAS domain S-box-containing protein
MNEPSENTPDWEAQRDRIIGLGETSLRKSYYPELQQRILELEKKNRELQAAYAAQTAIEEELRQQFDETSHKERALQENEERLVMAQEIGHTGSWEHSFDTDQIWGSAEALSIYGFPPVAGYHPREEIEACIQDGEQARQAFADFRSGRKAYDIEITINPHDGSPLRVVRSIARLEKDEQGRPIRAVGAILDITESKRADKALRESEERFRQIFENSPVGMTLVTPEFRFFSVNPAWVAMTGYSEEELLKLSFPDITHPDHIAGDREHIRDFIEGRIPVYNTEKRYIRKDGSILWGLLRVTTIRDPQGKLRFLAAQIEDITERKRAADALRESEGRFRTLIEASPLPITLTREGIFIYANSAFCRMTGYSDPAEVTGKPLLDFVAPEPGRHHRYRVRGP